MTDLGPTSFVSLIAVCPACQTEVPLPPAAVCSVLTQTTGNEPTLTARLADSPNVPHKCPSNTQGDEDGGTEALHRHR